MGTMSALMGVPVQNRERRELSRYVLFHFALFLLIFALGYSVLGSVIGFAGFALGSGFVVLV